MAERSNEARGAFRTSTSQSAHTESRERVRRGGGRYDAGPGNEGLPGARDMDRPPSECGSFDRTGGRRMGINRSIDDIQDQDRRGR